MRSAVWSTRFVRRTPQICTLVHQHQQLASGSREDIQPCHGSILMSRNRFSAAYGTRTFCTPSAPLTDDDGIKEQETDDAAHMMQNTKSVEELLQLVNSTALTCVNASFAIHVLVQHCYSGDEESWKSMEKLPDDPRVLKLYKALVSDISELSVIHMIRSLWNTYSLRLNSKYQSTVQTLINNIRPKMRSVDVSLLSALVCGVGVIKSSKGNKGVLSLVNEAARIIDLRHRELGRLRPHNLIGLLQVSNQLPSNFQTVIGDALLSSLHKFSFSDLKNLTLALASLPYRSPAILRAVMYQAIQLKDEWQLSSVAKFLWALGELSFHNQDLAKQVAEYVLSMHSEWTPSLVSQIARAYTQLRIHVPEWGLFDKICDYTCHNLEDFDKAELYNILYAFGELQCKPTNEKEFYKKVVKYMEARFADYPTPTKIKLAGALMVCEQVPEFMLKDVLQQRPTGEKRVIGPFINPMRTTCRLVKMHTP